jgi:hypothetical protein
MWPNSVETARAVCRGCLPRMRVRVGQRLPDPARRPQSLAAGFSSPPAMLDGLRAQRKRRPGPRAGRFRARPGSFRRPVRHAGEPSPPSGDGSPRTPRHAAGALQPSRPPALAGDGRRAAVMVPCRRVRGPSWGQREHGERGAPGGRGDHQAPHCQRRAGTGGPAATALAGGAGQAVGVGLGDEVTAVLVGDGCGDGRVAGHGLPLSASRRAGARRHQQPCAAQGPGSRGRITPFPQLTVPGVELPTPRGPGAAARPDRFPARAG